MIDITLNIEPKIRGGINPLTGEWCLSKAEGYAGSIIVEQPNQQVQNGMYPILEWHHIEGETMRDVAECQLIMLDAMKADIDKMIAEVKHRLTAAPDSTTQGGEELKRNYKIEEK